MKDRFYIGALYLYVTSLFCSMAGMEAFSGVLSIAVLITTLFFSSQTQPRFKSLTGQKALDWSLILLGLAIILSGIFSDAPSLKAKFDVSAQARWVLILYALMSLAQYYQHKIEKIFYYMLILTIIISLYSTLQSFFGFDIFRSKPYGSQMFGGYILWRAKGFFASTMSYAYSMALLLCIITSTIFTGYAKAKGRRYYLITLAAASLLAVSIVMTLTRGAWLSLVVAIPLMLFIAAPKRALQYLLPLLLAAIILVSAFSPLRDRVFSAVNSKDVAISQRYDLWRVNWAMFLDHPVIGVGYGENSNRALEYNIKLFNEQKTILANAHNNVLQTLGGVGLLGFIPWLVFGAITFFVTFLGIKKVGLKPTFLSAILIGSFGAQVVMHIGGVTQATFYDKEVQHMYLLVLGLTYASINFSNSKNRLQPDIGNVS